MIFLEGKSWSNVEIQIVYHNSRWEIQIVHQSSRCHYAYDIINIHSLLSCIHVNTIDLLNTMRTLVATNVILRKLECNKVMIIFGPRLVTC
jgi:hypothetical protein